MMIERVRLQRKFALKNKLNTHERIARIGQMMVVFELTFILTDSLISFSPHFHLHHVSQYKLSYSQPNFGLPKAPSMLTCPSPSPPSSYCPISSFGLKFKEARLKISLLLLYLFIFCSVFWSILGLLWPIYYF